MFWTIANTVERHFFTAVFTVVALLLCAGLSWWIWLDRFNRSVPQASDLLEIRGVASSPQSRNRSQAIWFRFRADVLHLEGNSAPEELQVFAKDLSDIRSALANGPVPVVAWLVRTELGRAAQDEPPSVLQLRIGDRTLLPLAIGQASRVERAANARMSAWIASAGIAVALIALTIHWIGKLRR